MTISEFINRPDYPLASGVLHALIEQDMAATLKQADCALQMIEPLYARQAQQIAAPIETLLASFTRGPGALRIKEVEECLLRYRALRALLAEIEEKEPAQP